MPQLCLLFQQKLRIERIQHYFLTLKRDQLEFKVTFEQEDWAISYQSFQSQKRNKQKKIKQQQQQGLYKPFAKTSLIFQCLRFRQLNTLFQDFLSMVVSQFIVFSIRCSFGKINMLITQTIIMNNIIRNIYQKIQLFFINSDMNAQIMELMQKKDSIEAQIAALTQQIKHIDDCSNFQRGLVDSQGFPRADVDFGKLSDYRNLKRKKAELNNDYSALMKQIEKKLFALHQEFPEIEPQQQEVQTLVTLDKKIKQPQKVDQKIQKKGHQIDYLTPFAKISIVDKESPASKGGLKVGDLVSQFAEVNIYSIDSMKQIPRYVKQGQQIALIVMRKVGGEQQDRKNIFKLKDGNLYEKIQIAILPSKWGGKGLLGCKIDPIH